MQLLSFPKIKNKYLKIVSDFISCVFFKHSPSCCINIFSIDSNLYQLKFPNLCFIDIDDIEFKLVFILCLFELSLTEFL